jgi:hypothetical protein
MAFKPLKDRIADLPLVICGPILRKVEPDAVTVWIALKEKKKVWLEVYEYDELLPGILHRHHLTKKLEAADFTVAVGERLHIAVVTGKLINANIPMSPGKLYYYNLFFTDPEQPPLSVSVSNLNLRTLGIEATIDFPIHYHDEANSQEPGYIPLPSFSLPPEDIDKLRIIHGSCRKPNAEGLDAMPTIDTIIEKDWEKPDARPHFLFLTGDQIYADDVSSTLLFMLRDAGITLFGNQQEEFESFEISSKELTKDYPEEGIKVIKDSDNKYKATWDGKLPGPNKRGKVIKHFANFSDKTFHNHLMSFAEYCCMYLFVWSNSFWEDLPSFEKVYSAPRLIKKIYKSGTNETHVTHNHPELSKYNNEIKSLSKFKSTLPEVRRALANVPTYMIFDDHEITDDWNMTKPWCTNVYSNSLGRRIVQNGMLAYSLFQAWGNTPEQFENSKPGGNILNIINQDWGDGYFDTSLDALTVPLGLPRVKFIDELGNPVELAKRKEAIFKPIGNNSNNEIFNAESDENKIIKWHYHIKIKRGEPATNLLEIIVLDGRTKRSYTKKDWHATLIHEAHQVKQIPTVINNSDSFALTIIVSPTAIIDIPALDFSEYTFLAEKIVVCETNKEGENLDIYDSWKNQSPDFEKLLARIAARGNSSNSTVKTRNIILTGDVHFAAASRLDYEIKLADNSDMHQAVFTQLVSSSLKKQTFETRTLHYNGYKFSALSGLIQKIPGFFNIPFLGLAAKVLITLIDRLSDIGDSNDSFYLFDPKLPKPREFFGWEDPNTFGDLEHLKIRSSNILVRLFQILIQENVIIGNDPVLGPLLENMPETYTKIPIKEKMIISKDQTLNVVEDITFPEPDWRYRIDYILAENEVRESFTSNEILDVGNPVPPDKNKALKEYLKASKNHSSFAQKYGSGKEIVGLNNVSEVSFDWKDEEKSVIQQTWWNLKDEEESEEFFPLTKYIVSLDFNAENLPKLTD